MKDPVFPNIIIGGAQKCGTSVLSLWLDEHPQMVRSKPKEPDYFSQKATVLSGKGYEAYYPTAVINKILFEASTGYFTDPEAARLIRQTLGKEVKLVFVLRSPIERTLSAYYHMFKHNADRRDLFEVFSDLPFKRAQILDYENKNLQSAVENGLVDTTRQTRYDDPFLQMRYIYNSFYTVHYEDYRQLFGVGNVLLLNLDKLDQNPGQWFKKLTDFIGVEPFEELPDIHHIHNRTRIPKYMFSRLVRSNSLMIGTCDFIYMVGKKMGLQKHFLADAPETPGEIKEKLNTLFEPEIRLLETL